MQKEGYMSCWQISVFMRKRRVVTDWLFFFFSAVRSFASTKPDLEINV